jgi:hypothetical protein
MDSNPFLYIIFRIPRSSTGCVKDHDCPRYISLIRYPDEERNPLISNGNVKD